MSYNNNEILYCPILFVIISFLIISILNVIGSKKEYILIVSFVFIFYLIVLNLNSERIFNPSFAPDDIKQIEGYVIKDQSKTKSDSYYLRINCKKGYLSDKTSISIKGQTSLLVKDDYNLLFLTPIRARVEYCDDINLYKVKDIEILSKTTKLKSFQKKAVFYVRDNRKYLIQKVKTYLKCPLSRMLILGRSDQEGFIYKQYALSLGCAHLLALSGMHLSVISMFFIFFFSKIITKKKAKYISLIVLSYFLYITGFIPSLIRSYIMYLLNIIIKESEIKKEKLLLFTAMIQAIIFPSTFISAGCLFSYGALSAIFIYSSIFNINNYILNMCLTTVFAILITYPLSISLGGSWCIFSVVLAPLLTVFITLEMIISLIVVINSVLVDFGLYYNFRHIFSFKESIIKLFINLIKEVNYYLQYLIHYNERLIRKIFEIFDKINHKMPKLLISYKGYLIFAIIVLTSTIVYLYSKDSQKIGAMQ
ncbi:MAG: ComEC/Rec2 family competence protein [Pleomorphochaeta sp.]